jgi:hypothetical protein
LKFGKYSFEVFELRGRVLHSSKASVDCIRQ